MDNTGYIGGNIAYNINNYCAIGAEAGWSMWNHKEDGIDYGDVHSVPLLANLYLRCPMESGVNTLLPYVVGGIGIVFWNYDESALLKDNGISVNMDSALGLKVGGGFDYFVSKNVALNFEGAYLWSDSDMTVSAFGAQGSATIDTDSWGIRGGLKFYFD